MRQFDRNKPSRGGFRIDVTEYVGISETEPKEKHKGEENGQTDSEIDLNYVAFCVIWFYFLNPRSGCKRGIWKAPKVRDRSNHLNQAMSPSVSV